MSKDKRENELANNRRWLANAFPMYIRFVIDIYMTLNKPFQDKDLHRETDYFVSKVNLVLWRENL